MALISRSSESGWRYSIRCRRPQYGSFSPTLRSTWVSGMLGTLYIAFGTRPEDRGDRARELCESKLTKIARGGFSRLLVVSLTLAAVDSVAQAERDVGPSASVERSFASRRNLFSVLAQPARTWPGVSGGVKSDGPQAHVKSE